MRFGPSIVVATVALLASCGGSDSKADEKKGAGVPEAKPAAANDAQIRVEPVRMVMAPAEQVIVPGKIEVNPSSLSKVAIPLPGRVTKVLVAVGDSVQKGKPLLILNSPETGTAVSNYQQAVAKVVQSKSGVAKAEADLAREQDLYAHGAVAEKEVLSTKAQLTQAQSELAQSNAAQDEAMRKLRIFGIEPNSKDDQVVVDAPVSGKVLDLSVVAGEYRNDVSAPVMTIADLSTIFMTADVPESSIRLIDVGDQVEMQLNAYPGEKFTGRVKQVADTVDPATRTVRVRVVLNNLKERFRPEMFGQLQISGPTKEMASVPVGAVIQTPSEQIVYRETSGKQFEPVTVKTGQRIEDRLIILSGLDAHSRIVVDGPMLVRGNSQ